MIGSCTFNFLVLLLVDFISWSDWNGEIINDRGIFIVNNDSRKLVIFGLATIFSVGILMIFKLYTNVLNKKKLVL